MHLAAVALDLPNVGTFTYAVPAGLTVAVGDGVTVPFRHGEREGFVVDVGDWPAPEYAVKPISRRIDGVRLPPHLLGLCAWAARYYRAGLGEVLAAAVPAPVRTGVKPERRVLIRQVPDFVGTLTDARGRCGPTCPWCRRPSARS
jgi:primosomal protein N' (replication factor Y) (superfamily II helicase)